MEYRIVEYENGKFGVDGAMPFYPSANIFMWNCKPIYNWLDCCGTRFDSLAEAEEYVKGFTIKKTYAI